MSDTDIIRKIEDLRRTVTAFQSTDAAESDQPTQRGKASLEGLRAALDELVAEIEQYYPVSSEIQAQIERAKQEWETTVDSLSELVCVVDDQGHILRANRTLESWNLGDVTKVKGQTLHEVLHPDCADPDCYLVAFWQQVLKELAQGHSAEYAIDDEVLGRHLRIRARRILVHPGHKRRELATFAVVAMYDITEEALHSRLLQLTQQVVVAEENERRRIAYELHDEAGQALTALKISLEMIYDALPVELDSLRWQMSDALKVVDMTTDRIRLLAKGLRPPALDAVGLNLALEDFCRMFARRTHLSITYAGTDLPDLPDPIETILYRFLQEALNNVAKHARANLVSVELSFSGSTVSLAVEDDGQGIVPPKDSSTTGPAPGIGLVGMRERVELLGGSVERQSRAGEGTRLVAHVPLKDIE